MLRAVFRCTWTQTPNVQIKTLSGYWVDFCKKCSVITLEIFADLELVGFHATCTLKTCIIATADKYEEKWSLWSRNESTAAC